MSVPRRERERERHRQEILEAARKVVAAHGLSGLTVEGVAREADFAVGSIYRHFRSKDEMIELLAVYHAEPMCEEAEAVAASGSPFEVQLDALVHIMYRYFSEDMPLIQVFHAAAGPMPAEGTTAGDRLHELKHRCVEAVECVLRHGQEAGVLPGGDPRWMTVALLGLMTGFARWSAFGYAPADAEPATLISRMFLDGVRAR